jgi:hypothetical protein
MEYCPARSPLSFSNRFAGGARRSFMFVERLSIRNFLKAILCKSLGNFRDSSLLKTFSVSLSLNDLIILKAYTPFNVKRQAGITRGVYDKFMGNIFYPQALYSQKSSHRLLRIQQRRAVMSALQETLSGSSCKPAFFRIAVD